MVDLGRFRLGDFVQFAFVATNASGTPVAPTAAPTLKTWLGSDVSTTVDSIAMPVHVPNQQTGMFLYDLRLDGDYAAGAYVAACQWATGGSTFSETFSFRVVPGGDADGNVIGAIRLNQPEAQKVVYQGDGGKLEYVRNPR